ncbi:hypothetical protein AB1A64_02445 [Ruegeria sp. ANG10]|uniref:hypothetical protein n=1 Tax=Ruegeria sp. ANG10 TaxID=3042467 RepID=UPI003452B4D5
MRACLVPLRWCGVAFALWACAGPVWAEEPTVTNATLTEMRIWFAAMTAAAVLLLAVFWSRRQLLFGLLGGAVLLGSAARLWLTQPLWFPRLEISTDPPENLIMLAILAAQAGLTFFVLMRPAGRAAIRCLFAQAGGLRLALLVVLIAAFSISATPYINYGYYTAFGLQIGVGGVLSLVQIATLVAVFTVSGPDHAPRLPVSGLAIFATLVSATLAWTAFDRVPHVEDELCYLFQARIFASGALWSPAPPEAAQPALDYFLLDIRDDRWLSVFAPGWSAVLSLGVLIGAPWLVNPLLTGASVWLTHDILRRTVSRERADLVALLMATSPWVLAVGASLMAHSATVFMVLVGLWCLLRAGSGSTLRDIALAFVAGLALGWVFVIRPLDGVIVGGLAGLWLLRRLPTGGGQVATYTAGGVLSGSAFLLFNYAFTEQFLLTPQADYFVRIWGDTGNAFGFGPTVGPPEKNFGALDMWPGHSPLEGLVNMLHGFAALNMELLGWVFGSLIPVWVALLWRNSLTKFDWAMLLAFLTIIGALFFYWFIGGFYIGPRYWYTAALPALVLAAAGIEEINRRLPEKHRGRLGNVVLLLCAVSVVSFTSWRGVSKYQNYGNYSGDIRRMAQAGDIGNALVFVSAHHNIGSALYLNDPFLPLDKPIFLRDLGAEQNAAVIEAFPGREVIYLGDAN